MWNHIDPEDKDFLFWEFDVSFKCPNCGARVSFSDQRQPYECGCGKEFALCMDVVERVEIEDII